MDGTKQSPHLASPGFRCSRRSSFIVDPWFSSSAFLVASKRLFVGYRSKPIGTKGILLITSIGSPGFTERAAPRAGRLLTADRTNRPNAPALFFVLILAFAVCSWGLRYKLSLYHAAGARPAVPAAKLLSQKERPVSFNDVDSVRPVSPQSKSSIFFPTIVLAAIVFGSYLVLLRWIRTVTTDEGCRQQNCAKSHCFSPRPPPALLLSC